MTDTNMTHLNHLEDVVAEDLAELHRKEATYKGSWKRGGGRSAWYMLRRKIDRLLVMMSPPPYLPGFSLIDLDDALAEEEVTLDASVVRYLRDCYVAEDVFAQIKADPSGADGTPLAEVRDLRRYLLLVEAEMMARGVVKTAPPPQTHADTVVREYLKVKPDEPRDGCEEKTNWPSIETFDTIAGKCWYIFDRNNPGFHHLPRPTYLFAELNYKEWELTEAWYRGMYNWEGEEGKWILQAQFLDKWKRRS